MSEPRDSMRLYTDADEAAVIDLWRRSWNAAYPQIDFDARVGWFRERLRHELAPACKILVIELGGELIGFAAIDPKSGYLDQIAVAPEHWGGNVGYILILEAQAFSPGRIDLDVNADNIRAIRFYEKHGFVVSGDGVNPRSGASTKRMTWIQSL